MIHLSTLRVMNEHGDWANDQVLAAAAALSDEQLDRTFPIGPGSLRRTLLHTHAGEDVWLKRQMGQAETPWVNEKEAASVDTIASRWRTTRQERDHFFATLRDVDLPRMQPYRDSRGTRHQASLGDMLLQSVLHSTSHRAQLVNMIRQVGGRPPELDYMYRARRPVE